MWSGATPVDTGFEKWPQILKQIEVRFVNGMHIGVSKGLLDVFGGVGDKTIVIRIGIVTGLLSILRLLLGKNHAGHRYLSMII